MSRWLLVFAVAGLLGAAHAPAAVFMGAMGDSYTDETSLIDPNGQTAGLYNWVEILVHTGRADFGLLQSFPDGDPRKGAGNGSYKYNFALAGATTDSFLGDGEPFYYHSQCGSPLGPLVWGGFRAEAANFQYGMIELGGNNFIRESILVTNGVPVGGGLFTLPPNLVSIQKLDEIFQNWREGVEIASGGSNVRMLVGNIPDLGTYPFVLWDTVALTAEQRANISAHTDIYNVTLAQYVTSKHWALVDVAGWWDGLHQQGVVTVGGVAIEANTIPADIGSLADLTYIFINDGLHPSPIGHGLLANLIIDTMTREYGETGIQRLSDQELLAIAGLDGGAPTATPSPPAATSTPAPTSTPSPAPSPTPTSTWTQTPSPSPSGTPLPPPQRPVLLAGYLSTDFGPGAGTIQLYAYAPGVDQVSVLIGGIPIGLQLATSGTNGVFWRDVPVDSGAAPGTVLLEMQPIEGRLLGPIWPYLTVER